MGCLKIKEEEEMWGVGKERTARILADQKVIVNSIALVTLNKCTLLNFGSRERNKSKVHQPSDINF